MFHAHNAREPEEEHFQFVYIPATTTLHQFLITDTITNTLERILQWRLITLTKLSSPNPSVSVRRLSFSA